MCLCVYVSTRGEHSLRWLRQRTAWRGLRRLSHLWLNEAMRAVVEGVKVFIFCHFRENEALSAVVEGVEVVIFRHFWEMRRSYH